jgi:hypothetical protein
MKRYKVLCGVLAVCLLASGTAVAHDRANVTQKGSLLVWPCVTVKWNAAGDVIEDTFISITNDLSSLGVRVKLYFVNGDDPVPLFGPNAGSMEPGCNFLDNLIELTHDEPAYWSALTGQPKGVSPFTALDPDGRADDDPLNLGGTVLRGFIIGFAVNDDGTLRNVNHLTGGAVMIDYDNNAAAEYKAWAYRALAAPPVGPVLDLDGAEYENSPLMLLLDFYASGSGAFGQDLLGNDSVIDTLLYLLPMTLSFCPTAPAEPLLTNADIDVWNEDEVKFTGLKRCISCWDGERLSRYTDGTPYPNHFLLANLGTDKGKARLMGAANAFCDRPADPNASPPDPGRVSVAAPLLGVSQKLILWGADRLGRSASTLSGMGADPAGTICFVPQSDPPEIIGGGNEGDVPSSAPRMMRIGN